MEALRISAGYGAPGDAEPRLYALLAVEVQPGKIVYYHLELDHVPGACTISIEQDTEALHTAEQLEPIRYTVTEPTRIEATISGTVVSDRPDYRPPARTPARIDENALTGYTRPLPLPAGEDR